MALFETLTQRVFNETAVLSHGSICPTMDVVLLSSPTGETLKLWRVTDKDGIVWTKDRSSGAPAETFTWSPDGQLLAVTSNPEEDETDLEICSVNDCKLVLPRAPIARSSSSEEDNSSKRKKRRHQDPLLQWLQFPPIPQHQIQAQELIRRLPALGAIVNRSAAEMNSNPASM